ncbi:MAG: hypothetical protein HOG85_04210, partial [Flavobacteriales bacterium]|nr:hypothetical protein [Flavobacteriales bacterium]
MIKKLLTLLFCVPLLGYTQTSHTIITSGLSFTPDTLNCNVGDSITFVLGSNHNAMEVDQSTFNSGGTTSNGGFNVGFGQTQTIVIANDQSYYYVCQPHVNYGMKGVIIANSITVYGCTDSTALNYDANANIDDGSCAYPACTDSITISITTDNYPEETSWALTSQSNGIIASINPGDLDSNQTTYNWNVCINANECYDFTIYDSYGDGLSAPFGVGSYSLTYEGAVVASGGTFGSSETTTNVNCITVVNGCTDSTACNYDPLATIDDGSCLTAYGCMDVTAFNYDPLATCMDSTACVAFLYGCTDSLAVNYYSAANADDGSCTYQMTYVPDDNFELKLIALGHDSGPLDDSVLTSNINTITILDVSYTTGWPIHDMTGIEDFTALVRLYCNNNHIDEFNTTTSMDLSGLTNLTHLRCQWNFLYSLDVSQNTALIDLDCGGNDLTSLDVSQNTALIELGVYGNDLTSLDVSNNTALTGLWCPFNYLTSVDVSNHTSLTTLVCNNNDFLTSVDMRNGNNTNLVYFNANNNLALSCIDVDDPFWMYTYFSNSINGSTSFSGSCSGLGCMDPMACNYNSYATTDDGSCQLPDGCTDPMACNYDSEALCDDGSCGYISGCTDPTACNYDALATCDDGSCSGLFGCTDPTACNYDALATCDDGSCGYISGCTDPTACNYDALATCDDGSCAGLLGCTDSSAVNYDPLSSCDDGSCFQCDLSYSIISASPSTPSSCDGWLSTSMVQTSYLPVTYLWSTGSTQSYILNLCSGVYTVTVTDAVGCSIDTTINVGNVVLGCTDMTACNYDPLATIDDGSCLTAYGCMDVTAFNYDPLATCMDSTVCVAFLYGCTDSLAVNYYSAANADDGSCSYSGCTDPLATNYDPNASIDDGSCTYPSVCGNP